MIELWKLFREVRRVGTHISGFLSRAFEVLSGGGPELSAHAPFEFGADHKVAIFVIYQPKGVAVSTLRTVTHLKENGFSVCVVSNSKLSTNDQHALATYADVVLVRPNVGYDFGAYQTAICSLHKFGSTLRCLLLLNDSVWFPLHTDSTLLKEMEQHEADVTSAQIFGETLFAGRYDQSATPILGSYFLMFKPAALRHPKFRSFWQDYRMSSNKETTVRRGERGLSTALFRSGLLCAGIYSQARYDEVVAALDDDGLRACLADLIILDQQIRKQRTELLAQPNSPDWSKRARRCVFASTKTKNYIGSSPLISYRYLGVDVVKKNNEMLYRLARKKLSEQLYAVDDGTIDSQIKTELMQAVMSDRLPRLFRPADSRP
jgi:hypothetical protein